MCFSSFIAYESCIAIMSRSSRHHSSSSRGRSISSYPDSSIAATTSSLHALHLTETAGAGYLSVRESYAPSSSTRRAPSHEGRSLTYAANPYGGSSYHRATSPAPYTDVPPSTVNPSDLTSTNYQAYGSVTYAAEPASTDQSYLSAADMRYPDFLSPS